MFNSRIIFLCFIFFISSCKSILQKQEQFAFPDNQNAKEYSLDQVFFDKNKNILLDTKTKQPIDGIVVIREQDVITSKINYKNGVQEGSTYTYYKNGKTKTKINISKGITNGLAYDYFESGSIKKVANFKNGTLDGTTRFYDQNGNLNGEMDFKNGKKDGFSRVYYVSGSLKAQFSNKNGLTDGLMEMYLENGSLCYQILYINDKIVSGKHVYGREFTNAELVNFEHALGAKCE